ncbi:MAG: glycosyltransferase family 2 protein [Methanobacterium sp.]
MFRIEIVTVIPCYNEEEAIKEVVNNALKYSDVLVVDDGSTDKTSPLAVAAGAMIIKHQINLGKGAAIKTGLKKVLNDDYKIIILMDGDGQHNPQCIPLIASGIGKAKIIIGSRFINGNQPGMTIMRRLSNKLTTINLKSITGYQVTDSQSGFRAISSDIAHYFINIPYNDYIYESELIYQASKKNVIINEKSIPCTYKNEKSYITWINVLNYTLFLITLPLRELKWKIKH